MNDFNNTRVHPTGDHIIEKLFGVLDRIQPFKQMCTIQLHLMLKGNVKNLIILLALCILSSNRVELLILCIYTILQIRHAWLFILKRFDCSVKKEKK